jgi:hypothetical protein
MTPKPRLTPKPCLTPKPRLTPKPFALSLSKRPSCTPGFDKLSPNGVSQPGRRESARTEWLSPNGVAQPERSGSARTE